MKKLIHMFLMCFSTAYKNNVAHLIKFVNDCGVTWMNIHDLHVTKDKIYGATTFKCVADAVALVKKTEHLFDVYVEKYVKGHIFCNTGETVYNPDDSWWKQNVVNNTLNERHYEEIKHKLTRETRARTQLEIDYEKAHRGKLHLHPVSHYTFNTLSVDIQKAYYALITTDLPEPIRITRVKLEPGTLVYTRWNREYSSVFKIAIAEIRIEKSGIFITTIDPEFKLVVLDINDCYILTTEMVELYRQFLSICKLINDEYGVSVCSYSYMNSYKEIVEGYDKLQESLHVSCITVNGNC